MAQSPEVEKSLAKKFLEDKACEVCGAPAELWVLDTEQTEPAPDREGNLWVTRVPAGTHYFCKAHERKPRDKPWASPEEEARAEQAILDFAKETAEGPVPFAEVLDLYSELYGEELQLED